MTRTPMLDKLSGFMRTVATVAVVALIATVAWVMWPEEEKKYLTATFPRTVAVYEGSEVKILGVPVGKVESVDPNGTQVRVKLWYAAETDVPANAKAVIISPSVVGDRFVQLTPAYNGGPTLADGAHLDEQRTAEPVELDEIYQSLNDLNVALGPKGANKDGSLSRLLEATARNFDGQGRQFHQTITDVSRFTGTLDNNKEEMFASLRQLARFTAVLRANDQNVRAFNRNLAEMSVFLEGERDDLAGALANLGRAMDDITGFVRSNRSLLKENIDGLTRVSGILVKQRQALKEIMDVAPLALNNLAVAYNPLSGTLDQRSNLGENVAQLEHDPALFLCTMVNEADSSGQACRSIRRAVGALNDLPLPRPRSAPFDADRSRTVHVERIDKSLGGILAGGAR
jgi:phospholipid/cholesterol/gamma-HCH transport system substrate-binding protein